MSYALTVNTCVCSSAVLNIVLRLHECIETTIKDAIAHGNDCVETVELHLFRLRFAFHRTMDRLAYDLGAEYGSDPLSDASYNADVDVIYCSLFCATENALQEYMFKRSIRTL